MESLNTASSATSVKPHLMPYDKSEGSSFRFRNPAIAGVIRERLENERAVLAQALAAFQAELTAHAA